MRKQPPTPEESAHMGRVKALSCEICEARETSEMDSEINKDEVWVPAFGWDGFYEVSSGGRVRSILRQGMTPYGIRNYGGSELNPIRNYKGYLLVNMTKPGTRIQVEVHRLILASFLGPSSQGMHGCHNNGIRDDNRLANLRWDTPEGNHGDMVEHGTSQNGARNGNSKLTEDVIPFIRASSESITELAKKYGVSRHAIYCVKHRTTWMHVA